MDHRVTQHDKTVKLTANQSRISYIIIVDIMLFILLVLDCHWLLEVPETDSNTYFSGSNSGNETQIRRMMQSHIIKIRNIKFERKLDCAAKP